jgi:indolepyruvate ferredoxin oxidoreductase alpha subunit
VAERSFKKEVQSLRLGEGEEFRGEGILAVTKALLQAGVSYVAGYQGAPISHLMDVLTDANDILAELGVHFEHSASEATATATLAASVHYPLRGAVTFKSTVGTNVASDALANLASGGVTGGAMLIVGEDYGEGSSIMQERSHAFAMKSQVWLLDPRPNLPKIVEMVEKGFELSEASNTPVMLELRIRACHVHGRFRTKDNVRPSYSLKDAIESPRRDTSRIVLPPASYLHEQEKIHARWPAAVRFIREHGLNEHFEGDQRDLGIIMQGGLYNGVIRALQGLGLADAFGRSRIPLYVLNVTYPLVDEEVVGFCAGKRAVLLVEEGQPDFIEQALNTVLRRADLQTRVHGKDLLPMAGEYTGSVLSGGLARFVGQVAPALLAGRVLPRAARAPAPAAAAPVASSAPVVARIDPASIPRPPRRESAAPVAPAASVASVAAAPSAAVAIRSDAAAEVPDPVAAVAPHVHPRPPSFCTGCPERPIFTAMKLLERELGPHHVSCDIGCNLFSILPPFNIGATTMGYGLGWAGAAALNTTETSRRTISVMGDGGFWHNGLTSGVGNAVFNRSDNVLLVIDNGYSAATGGQDVLSSAADNPIRATRNPIERAIRGVGVEWVRTVTRTYSVAQMRDTLREALTTPVRGPKVVIAQSECMLNRQRREKPLQRKAIADGRRVVRERFGVDPDTCTGDHSCIRLSGCPSLTVRDNPDPLRTDPVAAVVDSCVGCGLCGEVSHAAVLCPSFYRAGIVHNPDAGDRRRDRWRRAVIGWLQARIDRRLAGLQA